MSTLDSEWSAYYAATRSRPPRELMVEALDYLDRREQALDLGAGALNDTKFLLAQGFDVTAVDVDPGVTQEAQRIMSPAFHLVISAYDQYQFPSETFDLVSAQYALPFNAPDTFDQVIENIKKSLRVGGVFCGQFFGDRDEFKTLRHGMTFLTAVEAQAQLNGLTIMKFQEEEKDDRTATGGKKHWHVFHFIAKK